MSNFRPIGDRILIEQIETETKSLGGIIIPDSAKERPSKGKVIAVGKGHITESGQLIPIDIHAGETVFYRKFSGTEVKIDGQDFLIVRENEILGVIE